jgi:DNA polymerase-3 subunit alpha
LKQKGYSRFALTDINNTSACLDTIRLTNEYDIKPVVGIDFRNDTQQMYVGIARNNEGFRELNEHLTLHLHSGEPFDERAPEFSNAYVIYPANVYKEWPLRENEFIGISIKNLATLAFQSIKTQTNKLVALQPVTYPNKAYYNAHRLLRAIDTNTLLSKLPVEQQAGEDEMLLSRNEMLEAYSMYSFIIDNTGQLLNDCHVDFKYGKLTNKNKKYYTTDAASDISLLQYLCKKGLQYRYPKPTAEILARVDKEIDVIRQMNFGSYFLINWDIINYARSRNYYYVGRGSGANSIVAYLLRISDVDPIELDLYFERFINIYRSNAPDFDIDFSWTDRDDMTRYIFNRFGDKHTALVGAYNTFQHDAVIRELGKVFGLPPGEIDKLQNTAKYPDIDSMGKLVLRYSKLIHGFPNHLSVHSSGILISEQPISYYTATNMPPKGYPVTQFSMQEAEDIGLYKFDILSQRGLGKIKDSLEIIKGNKGDDIDIHNIAKFKNDQKVKDLLKVGKAIGCFYVESPAMRMLLAKLRADDYLRLVAASSIIRPGVAKSGMMREYIVRYRDENLRRKAREQLPELYDLLEETYGVMVYQEDVIKVAHFFAGLTLAEADYLRRGMSWKFKQRNEFFVVRENFFANCRIKNCSEKVIEDIWTQIETFANFAFSKGHSASYAVESYQALYLKAYYPLEYMVATLNNGGGFYRAELYIHEAHMHGAEIRLPCINTSDDLCVIRGNVIYLGFNMISELEKQSINEICEERKANGPFKDLHDVVKRLSLSIEQMRLLIRAGALGFTKRNKKELLWEVHSLMYKEQPHKKLPQLFYAEPKSWKLPNLHDSKLENAFDEIELFGFSLCSPFDLLRDEIPVRFLAKDFPAYINKVVSIVGYFITKKNTRTSKGESMHFGTFIDLEGNWIDTVHFPPSAKKYPFTGPGCYLIKGKVVEEYDFISIEVNEMHRLPVIDREVMREGARDNGQLAIGNGQEELEKHGGCN